MFYNIHYSHNDVSLSLYSIHYSHNDVSLSLYSIHYSHNDVSLSSYMQHPNDISSGTDRTLKYCNPNPSLVNTYKYVPIAVLVCEIVFILLKTYM